MIMQHIYLKNVKNCIQTQVYFLHLYSVADILLAQQNNEYRKSVDDISSAVPKDIHVELS